MDSALNAPKNMKDTDMIDKIADLLRFFETPWEDNNFMTSNRT